MSARNCPREERRPHHIDAEKRELTLEVPSAELKRRKRAWKKPAPRYNCGVLAKYAAQVTSAYSARDGYGVEVVNQRMQNELDIVPTFRRDSTRRTSVTCSLLDGDELLRPTAHDSRH